MKKLFKFALLFIIIITIMFLGFIQYSKPTQNLTMNYAPIDIQEKIKHMVTSLKTELVLTESDLDALIKQNLNPILNNYMYISGATFQVEDSILYAKLIITTGNKILTEVQVTYDVSWSEPNFILNPRSLHIKDLPLPTSLLESIIIPIYDTSNSLVKISSVKNEGNNLIVKWKLDLPVW